MVAIKCPQFKWESKSCCDAPDLEMGPCDGDRNRHFVFAGKMRLLRFF